MKNRESDRTLFSDLDLNSEDGKDCAMDRGSDYGCDGHGWIIMDSDVILNLYR